MIINLPTLIVNKFQYIEILKKEHSVGNDTLYDANSSVRINNIKTGLNNNRFLTNFAVFINSSPFFIISAEVIGECIIELDDTEKEKIIEKDKDLLKAISKDSLNYILYELNERINLFLSWSPTQPQQQVNFFSSDDNLSFNL
jgi:hypothetical protein